MSAPEPPVFHTLSWLEGYMAGVRDAQQLVEPLLEGVRDKLNHEQLHGRCIEHQRPKQRPGSTRQWRKQRARATDRDHGVCWICGLPGADSGDHVIRVRDGGVDELSNTRAAHLDCNLRRG
jgi:5-methylcytosine-specific restriction endonuclease McrA